MDMLHRLQRHVIYRCFSKTYINETFPAIVVSD